MNEYFFSGMLESSNTFTACFKRAVVISQSNGVVVKCELWREFMEHVSSNKNISLHYLTAIDHGDGIEVVCNLRDITSHKMEIVRCMVKDNTIDSISKSFEVACFYEREIMEMFGIIVQGLENTNLLLLHEDMLLNPLQKSVVLEERVNWPGGFDPAGRRQRTTIGELE